MYLNSIDNTDCLECDLNYYSYKGDCLLSSKYKIELEFTILINIKIILVMLLALIN